MQGWRTHMEDSHCHILSLPDDPDASFFAVYDGHGGSNIAKYSSKHLHKYIVKRPEYKTNPEEAMIKVSLSLKTKNWHKFLQNIFLCVYLAGNLRNSMNCKFFENAF